MMDDDKILRFWEIEKDKNSRKITMLHACWKRCEKEDYWRVINWKGSRGRGGEVVELQKGRCKYNKINKISKK